ncbi:hypothetical protein ACFOVU_10200 [Nocardiopsis sediminis]|uniref:Uncharacterized protein n=1 Tax=Nocardiopsis sediminis TaxID=1778267 RepID=A0ABV8FKD0_9ACTN
MEPWTVLAAGVVGELIGVVALWARVSARERTRRREAAARVDVARVVAGGGGRVTEYYPGGGRKVVIEVSTPTHSS